ncbi:MAG: hypothetical protein FGM32_05315 [Candidatus Kapabacteria bacterium]|nr:hypothetical protein [Candidatus Kapabacteria bacterium]
MSDDRIEPSIDHEFVVTFMRQTSKEQVDELLVHVITKREFTSFAYTLGLNVTFDTTRRVLLIEIGGLSIPSVMMPAAGGAASVRGVPFPSDGVIDVEILRKTSRQAGRLAILNGAISIEMVDSPDGFARLQSGDRTS